MATTFFVRWSSLAVLLFTLAPASAAEPLRVMTYNLRYASDRPPNAWPDRRPLVKELIERTAPDIMGTQEGVYRQLKELDADLPDYTWIGLGREGGSRGEFMAVFYRTDRFEPLAFDHFWLSDTPEVIGSTTWGNSNRRMVTWVRFKDRRDGAEFFIVNTHFDHQIQAAREKSAALVRERIAALKTELPVILLGDFNADAGANPAYDTLVKDGFLRDAWLTATERTGDPTLNTFNGFQPAVHESRRIDWILLRGPVRAARAEIIEFGRGGQYPSDHFPVVAWLRFGAE